MTQSSGGGAENTYRLSLTADCCKFMEHIIYKNIMDHLDSNTFLVNYQHGFRQKNLL